MMKTLILALFMMSFKLSALDIYHLHLKRLYKISNAGTPEQSQEEIAFMVYDFASTEEGVAYQSKRELHLVTATERLKIADDIDTFKFSGETLVYKKGRELYTYSTLTKKNTLIDRKVMNFEVKDDNLIYAKEAGSLYLLDLNGEEVVRLISLGVGQFKLPN